MSEIDPYKIKLQTDIEHYTSEEIEELSSEVEYLLELDGDSHDLTENEYSHLTEIQNFIASVAGGKYAQSKKYKDVYEDVSNLLYLDDEELSDGKIIRAVEDVLQLLTQGVSISGIDFELISPPEGYENKWIAIKSFPDLPQHDGWPFDELEDVLDKKFTDKEKDEAIAFSKDLFQKYKSAIN